LAEDLVEDPLGTEDLVGVEVEAAEAALVAGHPCLRRPVRPRWGRGPHQNDSSCRDMSIDISLQCMIVQRVTYSCNLLTGAAPGCVMAGMQIFALVLISQGRVPA